MVRGEVLGELRASGSIPASVNIDISGASDQLDATREALSGNYLVAVVIIYLLLVAIFTHWGYPLLIMTTIPLGVAGGIVGLWLMNWVGAMLPTVGLQALSQPFDMIAMLGFLILMGTVVNNPILIVHQAMRNVRDRGMAARDAVRRCEVPGRGALELTRLLLVKRSARFEVAGDAERVVRLQAIELGLPVVLDGCDCLTLTKRRVLDNRGGEMGKFRMTATPEQAQDVHRHLIGLQRLWV